MNKLISIIIPVYNLENYVERALASILNQTYKNFEAIIVDDGSYDNSYFICDEFVKKDDRFKLFKKENGGVSSARNYGLKIAKGDYILFVDGDDYLELEALEILVNDLNDDIDVLMFSFSIIEKDVIKKIILIKKVLEIITMALKKYSL